MALADPRTIKVTATMETAGASRKSIISQFTPGRSSVPRRARASISSTRHMTRKEAKETAILNKNCLLYTSIPPALWIQLKEQAEHTGCLGGMHPQAAVLVEILLQKRCLDLSGQRLIFLLVLHISQSPGRLGGEGGGVEVERRGGVGQVCGAIGVLGIPVLPVQGQPIAQLAAPQP